jgi:aryl-alcohol dehydrogenase-like predicted oxidoreductase
MSIFSRLALGTANFGMKYNGVKVSEDEQKKILDYCQCSGIDTIHTAAVYEWNWNKANSYFNVIVEGNTVDLNTEELYAYLIHTGSNYPYKPNPDTETYYMFDVLRNYKKRGKLTKIGISAYPDFAIEKEWPIDIIQTTYSIYDRRNEQYFAEWKNRGIEIHIRSIFLQGKILQKFSPRDCINFCLMNPYIDRVIIGVDSLQQLKDNLRHFHRMNSAEVHDENILDPRKWEGRK